MYCVILIYLKVDSFLHYQKKIKILDKIQLLDFCSSFFIFVNITHLHSLVIRLYINHY